MKKIILFLMIFVSVNQLKAQVLNVSEITQEQDQWCWAGVSSCILDYYCTPTSQCTIAEYTRTVETFYDVYLGYTNCCTSPSSCNNWNYGFGGPGSIQDILVHFANISNDGLESLLSQAEITSDILDNRVFVIRWGYNSGGGHFVLGHGLVGNNLYYMDPWYGEGLMIADYSWVCSGDDHNWTHTNRLTSSPSSQPANAGTISGSAMVCQGQNSVTYSVPEIANTTSYIWTLPGGATGTSSTNSITINFSTSATSGNITVMGTNSCGNGESSSFSITVNPAYFSTENHSICEGETYNWHGTEYTSAGTYTTDFNSVNGCDSVCTLNLSVVTVDTSLTVSDPVITANLSGAAYQWLDCNNSYSPISGEQGQSFTADINGNYAVLITQGLCSDTSTCVPITSIGIVNGHFEQISVYPNPVSNELIIEMNGNNNKQNFEVINTTGQVVFKGSFVEKTIVPTSSFVPGIYTIKLENGKIFEFKKIIKE